MVGTHLLPPNLLKLFTPRPPLPYAKPPGRDPDLPLKSLSSRRAPQPIVVGPVLEQIRKERITPAKGEGEGESEGNDTAHKPEDAEVKLEEAAPKGEADGEKDAHGDSKMGGPAAEKEEGEEPGSTAAPAAPASAASAAPKKTADDAVAVDLCAEEQFQLRKRERERRRKEAMSKPYAPQDDEEICGDPYKTLFVGRLPHEVTEKDLLREFELYGPIERLRLVTDPKTGSSRGYAFIVYERERDMKAAYKDADGLKMKGRRVLIDVERGRTVKGWKPRRLGGGLGGRIKKLKGGIPAPEPHIPPPFMGGGGYRGGFGGPPRGGGYMGGGGRGGGYMGRGGFGGPPRGGGYMGGGGGGGGGGGPPRFGGPPPGGPAGAGPGPGYGPPPVAGRGGFGQHGGGIGYGPGAGAGAGMRGPPAPGPGNFQGQAGPDGGYGSRAAPGGPAGEKRPYGDGPGGPGAGAAAGSGYGGSYGGGDEKRLRY